MDAIRRIITRTGRDLHIVLPDNFTSKKVECIILPFDEPIKSDNLDIEAFRKNLKKSFQSFNADLKGYKFNRDELYDRP